MATNVDKTVATLSKLYDKRAALDKQILAAHEKLVAAASAVDTVKKTATKKAANGKKAVAKKRSLS
jgi:hypothetical protein